MTIHHTDERGSVSTELAVLAPLLIGFMLLVVLAGRVAQTDSDVHNAAHEAARAASLTGTPAAAAAAGEDTAAGNIAAGGVACRHLDVTVDTSSFRAGGHVAVTVTCRAALGDIAMLAVPGSRTYTATAVEVIDTHRGDAGSGS